MKYLDKSFQTGSNSQAYKDSWDRMFGEPDTEAILDELVALSQEMGGYDELRSEQPKHHAGIQDFMTMAEALDWRVKDLNTEERTRLREWLEHAAGRFIDECVPFRPPWDEE